MEGILFKVDSVFHRYSPGQVRAASLLLIALVAGLDIVTGSEFSVFDFLPDTCCNINLVWQPP